jgi:hypothetical protein
MLTPSSNGADKKANAPVSGSNVPMFKGADALLELSEPLLELLSSSSPQAAAIIEKESRIASSHTNFFFIYPPIE